jgi:molybdopterin-guanine dinucleotide biosynthesis protein A
MLTGALLAGGRSRRMGRDKALLPVAGEPLWRRQVRVLRESGAASVAVVLRQGQPALPGMADGLTGDLTDDTADAPVRTLRDQFPEAGPLAGLHAALTATPAGSLLMLLAVDLPQIEADWYKWLLRFCHPGAGAVAHLDGFPEPLAAIYPAAALPFAADCLASGDHAMRRLIEQLTARDLLRQVEVPRERRKNLANCNAPSDYAALLPASQSTP